MIFNFVFENFQNSFSWGPHYGPFWSTKYLSFCGENCDIRSLSCSIQETYTLRRPPELGNDIKVLTLIWVDFLGVCFEVGRVGVNYPPVWNSLELR